MSSSSKKLFNTISKISGELEGEKGEWGGRGPKKRANGQNASL